MKYTSKILTIYRKDFKSKKEKSGNLMKILLNVLLILPVFYSSCGLSRSWTVAFYITDQEHKRYEWGSVFSPVMPGGNGRDIFIVNWNFLTKFFSFDPSFHRNILASLYLKSVTSVRAYLRDYSFTHTLCKFHDMVSVANLHWGYLLITGAHIYCHKCGYVTLPRNTIRCATSY